MTHTTDVLNLLAVAEKADTLPLAGIIGIVASIALLLGYALLSLGKLSAKDYSYQWLNVIGAAALTYTVIYPLNVGVLVTEALWTLIGLYGVWKIYQERKGEAHGEVPTPQKPRVK